MTSWRSLYLPYADNEDSHGSIVESLSTALLALGYERFDPFGIIPGKAYPQAVRLFVAPSRDGWVRILASELPDPALLSLLPPCLLVELDGGEARIEAYRDGTAAAPETVFVEYADCIRVALRTDTAGTAATVGGVALDALPGDVQSLAEKIDLRQAGKLFERMSAGLAQKSGIGGPAARDLLKQPDWNSVGGARIAALMDCLSISNWRTPDFVTLRDAYALHERRRRSPKAALYPGDAETMAAVPDALTYTPVYGGKG